MLATQAPVGLMQSLDSAVVSADLGDAEAAADLPREAVRDPGVPRHGLDRAGR